MKKFLLLLCLIIFPLKSYSFEVVYYCSKYSYIQSIRADANSIKVIRTDGQVDEYPVIRTGPNYISGYLNNGYYEYEVTLYTDDKVLIKNTKHIELEMFGNAEIKCD